MARPDYLCGSDDGSFAPEPELGEMTLECFCDASFEIGRAGAPLPNGDVPVELSEVGRRMFGANTKVVLKLDPKQAPFQVGPNTVRRLGGLAGEELRLGDWIALGEDGRYYRVRG